MSYRILFWVCCASLSYAMQQPLVQPTFKDWVQKATSIRVDIGAKSGMSENYPITATTTILDIKNNVHTDNGIPTANQRAHALWSKPLTGGFIRECSRELRDDETVKSVMNDFNTNRLKAYVYAVPQQQRVFKVQQFLPSEPATKQESKEE